MKDVFPIISLLVPIIAIVGGITMAIVRILSQARLEELARKERIAAIERGVDPEKLPHITSAESYAFGNNRLRRAHGLLIGGLILVALGVGMSVVFASVESDKHHWIIGIVPLLVGMALLLASRVVWPSEGDAHRP